MNREIVERECHVEPTPGVDGFGANPGTWLLKQAAKHGLTTLLAHADDGVIWGEAKHGRLHLSSECFPTVSPPFREVTLQECRLFGPNAELYVWRGGEGGWRARTVRDGVGELMFSFDEYQVLWGTRRDDEQGGFTLVSDGARGHRHAPPVPGDNLSFVESDHRPLRLQVRHYLVIDPDTGLVTVGLSRLVSVLPDTEVKQ